MKLERRRNGQNSAEMLDVTDDKYQYYIKRARDYLTDETFGGIDINDGQTVFDDHEMCTFLSNVVGRYQERKQNAFLILKAPMARGSYRFAGRAINVSLNDDIRFRDYEVNHFLSMFDAWMPQSAIREVTVLSKRQAEDAVRDFLDSEEARRAHIAWVFFDGHGDQNRGLCFQSDDPREKFWDLNNFLLTIGQLNLSVRSSPFLAKPLQVVFAQCWGHTFDPQLASQLRKATFMFIYSVTDKDTVLSSSPFVRNSNGIPIGKKHEGLIRFAEMFKEAVNLSADPLNAFVVYD